MIRARPGKWCDKKGMYRFRGMGMKTESKRKLRKGDSSTLHWQNYCTVQLYSTCDAMSMVIIGLVTPLNALTHWLILIKACAQSFHSPFSFQLMFLYFTPTHTHTYTSEAMETSRGGQKGGRADGLYPLPARFHLCGRWDPILRLLHRSLSCKTTPFFLC